MTLPKLPPVPEAAVKAKAKLDREARTFQAEVLDKMSALATAAFGLVAALAWNNAIQSFFKRYYPTPDDPNALGALTAYAAAVTVVAVVIIIAIGRLAGRLKKEALQAEEEEKAATPSA